MQSKVHSFQVPDGICREHSREQRACHIDVCGMNDVCRVPFVVHAILRFVGGDSNQWNMISNDVLGRGLATLAARDPDGTMFEEGDVKVIMTSD